MKTNLFEQLILWLYRNKIEFTIKTGLVYGHKIYKTGVYTFTELSDNMIGVTSDNGDFNYKIETYDEMVKLLKAMN